MFHHCHDAAHKQYPYLGGGCARGPNAKHHQRFVFPLDDVKKECHACHNLVHPPLLWVCENKRWEPSVRGVCVQCAAILMIEDQDGPNIVVQNSHTVLVTSLFCVKIAHELRAVYADVIDKEHDKIEVLLEAKIENEEKFVDCFVGIQNIAAVFIENSMIDKTAQDYLRIQDFVSIERNIILQEEEVFETELCNGIFGVVLNLASARKHEFGVQVLHYLAQGEHSMPLLLTQPPENKTRNPFQPLVVTSIIDLKPSPKKVSIITKLDCSAGGLQLRWEVRNNNRNTRQAKHFKHDIPHIESNIAVGRNFLHQSNQQVLSKSCILCGVPFESKNSDDPITLLEAVKDSHLMQKAPSLICRRIDVRQHFSTCLKCAKVFNATSCLSAFYRRKFIGNVNDIVARVTIPLRNERYFVEITEFYGRVLRFIRLTKSDVRAQFNKHRQKFFSQKLTSGQLEQLKEKLRPYHDYVFRSNMPTTQFFAARTQKEDYLIFQLVMWYKRVGDTYSVTCLFENINETKTCILGTAELPKQANQCDYLVYVPIGFVPETNLSSDQKQEYLAWHQACATIPRSLAAVQSWRILGIAAHRMLTCEIDVDLFLHHIWDPAMLDTMEEFKDKSPSFRWLSLPSKTDIQGNITTQALDLKTPFRSRSQKCGETRYMQDGPKFVCVYECPVYLWAFCARNGLVSFEVLLRVLFLDLFVWNSGKLNKTLRESMRKFIQGNRLRTSEGMLATERELQNIRKSEQFPRGDLGLAAHAAARVVGDHARAAGFEALRTHEWLRSVALG